MRLTGMNQARDRRAAPATTSETVYSLITWIERIMEPPPPQSGRR